jgi:hypothetical protein
MFFLLVHELLPRLLLYGETFILLISYHRENQKSAEGEHKVGLMRSKKGQEKETKPLFSGRMEF